MRHVAVGRHARYPYRPSRMSYVIVILAAVAAIIASLVFASQPESAQAQPAANQAPAAMTDRGAETVVADDSAVQLARAKTVAARLAAVRVRAAAIAAAHTYSVKTGDSMSSVAQRHCGTSRDWTGIYAASRARGWTARNANSLTAGQHLWLSCSYAPSMLRFAPAPPPPPVVRVISAVRSSGHAASSGNGTYHRVYHRSYAANGTYSYAGLERLWISAGGPSWAAAHAAEIAECESGGRTSAYNPSGATGLWQILGSVVPGNLYNAYTNALNAVAKFRASGSTFAQWVCR